MTFGSPRVGNPAFAREYNQVSAPQPAHTQHLCAQHAPGALCPSSLRSRRACSGCVSTLLNKAGSDWRSGRYWAQAVHATWHVINDQDAVARAPKFLFLYKRTGHSVIINHDGDMLVRPSFIETSIHKAPGGPPALCSL